MLTITLLGTAATMPLPDSRRRLLPAAATACCGTAARALRRQRAVRA